ncbi:putative methyltransferase DDB_G0268948 isoform X2 [Bacillus rossius redtenbacheri]|uniref:putative methyltransferase DDB_G0268948 isoform X2 n=1 Tax=Bacillus rossius redtenbacheri TaxID=93214 RepID=UPI002FDD74EC
MSFRYFEVTGHAAVYNKFRHSPPEHLIAKIVNYVKEKVPPPLGTAVDVGCGGGQSTLVLSPHFQHVVGVDPSAAQIEAARKRNTAANVSFRVGGAEQTGLEERSAQLVAASQACHWFHLPRFYAEAGRVLAPSGVLAMYGYTLPLPTHPGAPCLGDVVEKR